MPIALVHPDGSLRKVTKSTLMNLSEKDVTSKQNLPSSQHPTVDAIYLFIYSDLQHLGNCCRNTKPLLHAHYDKTAAPK